MKRDVTRLLPYLVLTIALPATAEQTVLLNVQGISDQTVYNNVRIYLSQLSNDEADGSERYQYLVQETVDKALRAQGYYNTQYQFSLTPRPAPQKDRLTLQVTLDTPVKLDERDIQISGEAAQDSEFQKILQNVPAQGSRLNHETYENFKSNLEKTAQARGYFDADWLYHRLEVYPTEHIADWRLGYAGGTRYRYGLIAFKNSQIREDYLTNMLRIKSGDHYLINDLSKLSSDFSSSNWFTSVIVDPKVDEQNKTVNLDVLLQPKKKNDIEVGIGYATDVGIRLQFNWKKPWINSRGDSIELNSYLSQPEQSVEFGYKIPLKSNPLNYYYQLSASAERENQNDTSSTAANIGFQRFWNHETGWAFSLGVKARYDAFEQANSKFNTLLVYPTASLNRTRSDKKRFPLWGDSQKLTVNWGSRALGSEVNFYSAKISSAWVRSFYTNHRFYLRAELGYLKSSRFEQIPPALRYFAGGDMSIRGFGYKAVSPTAPDGKLVGGSHLATGTIEYQYQVYPDWWGALFYDTGLAAERYSRQELHSGAGVGIRWASPIGAIKFDLATPVKSPNNNKEIKFYLGLGAEL